MISSLTMISGLLACSVCWGNDGHALNAANAGVGFMMVILLGVLSSLIAFIFYLARKSREANGSESNGPDVLK